MLRLSVKTDISRLQRKLDLTDKQAKYAAVLALTRSAQAARYALEWEMTKAFDGPTPFTLRSLYLRPATKSSMTASVEVKDAAFKSAGPTAWAHPEIYGGQRGLKRFEQRLQTFGVLPQGKYIAPGPGAKLDSYGNISRGLIQKIITFFGASSDSQQNLTAKTLKKRKKANATFFVVREKEGKLPAGIYQRIGRKAVLVLVFIRTPKYAKRYNFYTIGKRVIRESFGIEYTKALAYALRTAR